MRRPITVTIILCDDPDCEESIIVHYIGKPPGWQHIKSMFYGTSDKDFCPKHHQE